MIKTKQEVIEMKPTQEQTKIVEASKTHKVLKIEAYAGSGKTSTLVMVAEANPVPSLYLTFNKGMSTEAQGKFPDHVECRTIHSMAYRTFGSEIKHKLQRPKGRYVNVAGTAGEIAKYYKMQPVLTEDGCAFSSTYLGLLAQKTVVRFEQSSKDNIELNHVPYRDLLDKKKKYPTVDIKEVQKQVHKYAVQLWKDRIDLVSPVLATHDTYLKLYQLSKPTLNYDMVYIDESQDVSDVMIDIVGIQDCRKIYVGDSYQSIYQFRGAVNALQKIQAPTLSLTQSFRFGDEVADLANKIIDPIKPIKGTGSTKTMNSQDMDADKLPAGSCMLFRTNLGLLLTALDFISSGVSVDMPSNISGIKTAITSALALRKGDMKNVKHQLLIPFNSFSEFKEASEEDPELRGIYNLTKGSIDDLKNRLNILNQNDPTEAKYVLRTAHGSKGLEWDVVMVMDDFSDKEETYFTNQQEANLLYVATTRGKKACYYNPIVDMIGLIGLDDEPRADMANFTLMQQLEQEIL